MLSGSFDLPQSWLTSLQQGTYNMVVEIPRGKHAKMEISTSEEHNPIKQVGVDVVSVSEWVSVSVCE